MVLTFFFLMPVPFVFRKKMFREIGVENQIILSIGYGLYLFSAMIYALDFVEGNTILQIVTGLFLVGMVAMRLRVSKENKEGAKEERKTELRHMYLIFNCVLLLALLSNYHQ